MNKKFYLSITGWAVIVFSLVFTGSRVLITYNLSGTPLVFFILTACFSIFCMIVSVIRILKHIKAIAIRNRIILMIIKEAISKLFFPHHVYVGL